MIKVKIYNIKGSKTLFDKWIKLTAKTNKKVDSMFILQNDGETNSDELNAWVRQSMEDIKKVDQDFRAIVSDLIALREETIEYFKAQIVKEENK